MPPLMRLKHDSPPSTLQHQPLSSQSYQLLPSDYCLPEDVGVQGCKAQITQHPQPDPWRQLPVPTCLCRAQARSAGGGSQYCPGAITCGLRWHVCLTKEPLAGFLLPCVSSQPDLHFLSLAQLHSKDCVKRMSLWCNQQMQNAILMEEDLLCMWLAQAGMTLRL